MPVQIIMMMNFYILATYQENSLAVWSCHDYSLLAATTLQFPVHDIAWDPHVAYEFTAVGGGAQTLGVSFWMVEESKGGKEFQLKVCRPVHVYIKL